MAEVAVAQLEAGDRELAMETARSIEHSFIRAHALRKIAVAQARMGDPAAALVTARSIESADERARALRSLVSADYYRYVTPRFARSSISPAL